MQENPILLIASKGADAQRRGPAPQAKKTPLVDIAPLKPRLASQLNYAIGRATEATTRLGIDVFPLRVAIDHRALAKTSRPTSLLEDSNVKVAGSLGRGQILGATTLQAAENLRTSIERPHRSDYEYQISTVRDLALWEASTDAFGLGSLEASEALVEAAARSHRLLKFEFFPWVSLSTQWGNATVEAYLEDLGFNPVHCVGDNQRYTAYVEVANRASAASLASAYGIRAVAVSPQYRIRPMRAQPQQGESGAPHLGKPEDDSAPTLGILDSGVECSALEPWIVAHDVYDPPSNREPSHGTFVAGLVIAPNLLNGNDARFPEDRSRVVDAQVLPNGSIDEPLLLERITEVVRKYDGKVNVWNCSFSAQVPISQDEYSTFAQEMDNLARRHKVLFVQAAGNYVGSPARTWPPDPSIELTDGIASPADAVDSLAVGSLSHLGGLSPVGAPASYSRRGPGVGGMAKPDVSHWSGDIDGGGAVSKTGVKSLDVSGSLRWDVGTSFATPIVATTAANVWADLESSRRAGSVDPALVKGLVLHSALLSTHTSERHRFRDYFGAGVPTSSQDLLFTSDDVFTTVHEVDLVPGFIWWKRPFPIPACLIGETGKLRAEVVVTLSYAPVVDPAYGAECVRTNIDVGFGPSVAIPHSETPKFNSILTRHTGGAVLEEDLIADGKWSPAKSYFGRFPRGKAGDNWGLRMQLLERSPGSLIGSQRAYVVVSLRGLEEGMPVYRDGVAAIRSQGHVTAPLVARRRVRVWPGSGSV